MTEGGDIELDSGHRYMRGGFNYDREAMEGWLTRAVPTLLDGAGKTLLDVGCGDGFWTRIFRDWGWQCTGVDNCPEGIHIAAEEDDQSVYVLSDVFETNFSLFDTVYIRTFSPLNYRIDDTYMERVNQLWSIAESQMIWVVYTTFPYGTRIPGSNNMFYHHPSDTEKVAKSLEGGEAMVTRVNNYYTWRIARV
jgi:SAM-dependent methyltransferase